MTTVAVGNRRLLKLADILDTADALHKKRHEPGYAQTRFAHPCGTPACALGHWAAANPRRWMISAGSPLGSVRLRGCYMLNEIAAGMDEFAIDMEQYYDLFGGWGCGGAQTGKQAARFIRQFVQARQKATERSKL